MKSLLKLTVFAIFNLSLAVGCSQNSSSDGGGSNDIDRAHVTDAGTCEAFIAKLPSDVTHGWMTVSEEPENPASPQIQIFYFYKTPLKGRVTLFLNGGPGSDSHWALNEMNQSLTQFGLKDQASFVFMDQRGNGCSTGYPSGASDEEIMERAKWYGTRGIVEDAELLRQKLMGSQPWAIFGQSYGAFIVHKYEILYPQSLTKAIAYANTLNSDPMSRMINRVASQVRVWENYFEIYPEDRAQMQALLKNMTMDVCETQDSTGLKICGVALISPLLDDFAFKSDWHYLHDSLSHLIIDGQLQGEGLLKVSLSVFRRSSHQRHVSLATIDYYDRNVLPLDYNTCSAIAQKVNLQSSLTECSEALQDPFTSTLFNNAARYFGSRNDWMTLTDLQTSLLKNGKRTFYVYSGGQDNVVPVESFSEEINQVGSLLNYTNFPTAGHEGYFTEEQVLKDLVSP